MRAETRTERGRARLRSAVEAVAWATVALMLGAVFVGGLVWSISRHDQRGPVARVVAIVLLVAIAVLVLWEIGIGAALSGWMGEPLLLGALLGLEALAGLVLIAGIWVLLMLI